MRQKMMQDGNTSQRLWHGTCRRPGSLEMRPETQSLCGSKLKSMCTQETPVRGKECGIWKGEKPGKWFRRRLVSIRPPRGALGWSCTTEAVLAEEGGAGQLDPTSVCHAQPWVTSGGFGHRVQAFLDKVAPSSQESSPRKHASVCC